MDSSGEESTQELEEPDDNVSEDGQDHESSQDLEVDDPSTALVIQKRGSRKIAPKVEKENKQSSNERVIIIRKLDNSEKQSTSTIPAATNEKGT